MKFQLGDRVQVMDNTLAGPDREIAEGQVGEIVATHPVLPWYQVKLPVESKSLLASGDVDPNVWVFDEWELMAV